MNYEKELESLRASLAATGHCKDCCCARSWNALGVSEYTGKSIPEHITALIEERDRLQEVLSDYIEAGIG